MVAVKRYIHGFRRPRGLRSLLRFILTVAIFLLLLLGVRFLGVTQVEISSDRPDLQLLSGDRLLVNRQAWGISQACPYLFSPTESESELALSESMGEIVIYRHEDPEKGLCIGRINAPSGAKYKYQGRFPAAGCCIIDGADISIHRIVGKVICVSYSVERPKGLFEGFRSDRLFLPIP